MTDARKPRHTQRGQTEPSIWPRIVAVLGIIGGPFAWVVSNYEQALPVFASPAMLTIVLFSTYGLGGMSAYWLVARPLSLRLQKAEIVIRELRQQERSMLNQMADMREELASHRTQLAYMKAELEKKAPKRSQKPKE